MIDVLAAKVATGIKNTVPDHPASHAVLKFAVTVVLNVVFIVGLTMGVSILTGRTSEALQILISFALLRQVSGGAHLKSGLACVLFTTTLFTLLSIVEVNGTVVMVMNVVSLLIVLWLAPTGIERQTRIPRRHWPKLKGIAVLLVTANFVIGSPVIAASFFAQSISLIISRRGVSA